MQTHVRSATLAIWKSDPSITPAERATFMAIVDGKFPQPSNPHAVERILRRGEVASRFSVNIRTVDLWAKTGILEKVKLPGRIRGSGFRERDVLALINGKEAGHAA